MDEREPAAFIKKDPIPTFCQHLKKIREDAGFSIQSAALSTRISQPFLIAMESGTFENLPGIVFGRGFIRSLCRAYKAGSHEALLLEEFSLACQARGIEDHGIGSAVKEESAVLRRDRRPGRQWLWSTLLRGLNPAHYFQALPLYSLQAALGLIALGVYLYIDAMPDVGSPVIEPEPVLKEVAQETSATLPPAAAVMAESQVAPAKLDKAPAAVSAPVAAEAPAVAAAVAGPKGNQSVASRPAMQKVVMVFTKESGVRVKLDNEDWVSQTLPASTHTWEFKENADFDLNSPEGVQVEYNGQPIGPLTADGRRLTFARERPAGEEKAF